MANGIFGWSTTPASNATQDGINFAEGQLPSTVNDSARALMASVAKFLDDVGGVSVGSGSANAHTVTTATGLTSYATGVIVSFRPGYTNTGASTLNVDSVGAKKVFVAGANLAGGEIASGAVQMFVYDETLDSATGGWHLLTPKSVVNLSGYYTSAQTDTLLSGKQAADATLTALAALTTAANKLIYATGSDAFSTTDFTSDARQLLGTNFAGMLALLGAGSLLNVQFITASGTVTKNTGAKKWLEFVQGAGGGGYASTTVDNGGGGGEGGLCINLRDVSALSSLTATIASGGSSVTAGGAAAGNTSLGSVVAGGGASGTGAPGTSSGANLLNRSGGMSDYHSGRGASCLFGSGGQGTTSGSGYGGGGGGGLSGNTSVRTNGLPGCILILEFA